MKSKFMVILLALCLLCGCALADGIPEGTYRGVYDKKTLTFKVEDGIISGELTELEHYCWTTIEDDPTAIELSNGWVFYPSAEGYTLYGAFVPPEFVLQPESASYPYAYTLEDGRPMIELDIDENGYAYLCLHEYFRTDYVHGADPQAFTLKLTKPIDSSTRDASYRFMMENGSLTVYDLIEGTWAVEAEDAYVASNRFILEPGLVAPYQLNEAVYPRVQRLVPQGHVNMSYMLLVLTEDGGARLDYFFHIPEESDLSNVPEDYPFRAGDDFMFGDIELTQTADSNYTGGDYTLQLHEDGTFTLLKLSWGPWSFIPGLTTYVYEENKLTITDWWEKLTLAVDGDEVILWADLEGGHARRVE